MRISIIVAVAENGVIGKDGGLPWRLPADLKRFKALTTGHCIAMGRRTWDSIGRPLPQRTSIVISRNKGLNLDGAKVVHSLDGAVMTAAQDDELFVIGGGEIYREAMARADRLYLTRVHKEVEGDATFPEIDESEWQMASEEAHLADEKHDAPFTFQVFNRITE
jgi:dihydrofolate reductase